MFWFGLPTSDRPNFILVIFRLRIMSHIDDDDYDWSLQYQLSHYHWLWLWLRLRQVFVTGYWSSNFKSKLKTTMTPTQEGRKSDGKVVWLPAAKPRVVPPPQPPPMVWEDDDSGDSEMEEVLRQKQWRDWGWRDDGDGWKWWRDWSSGSWNGWGDDDWKWERQRWWDDTATEPPRWWDDTATEPPRPPMVIKPPIRPKTIQQPPAAMMVQEVEPPAAQQPTATMVQAVIKEVEKEDEYEEVEVEAESEEVVRPLPLPPSTPPPLSCLPPGHRLHMTYRAISKMIMDGHLALPDHEFCDPMLQELLRDMWHHQGESELPKDDIEDAKILQIMQLWQLRLIKCSESLDQRIRELELGAWKCDCWTVEPVEPTCLQLIQLISQFIIIIIITVATSSFAYSEL